MIVAVAGDDQRPHVADVGAQRFEVAAVAVPADDDQHLAVAERGPGVRELDAAGEDVGLLADVLDRVLGELGQRLVDPLPLLLEFALQLRDRADPAVGHRLAVDQHRAAVDPQPVAVGEQPEEVRLRGIDQADAGVGQHQRPGVGIATVRGGRGVEDGDGTGVDQLLGGDPVDVDVVDDGDVAGPHPLDQVLGAGAQTGRPFDRGVGARTIAAPQKSRQAPATGGGHRLRLGHPTAARKGLSPSDGV